MKEKLAKIREEILKQIDASENLDKLNEVRVSALGKKGALTELLKSMKEVAPQDRPKVGQMVNEVRAEIETALETEKAKLEDRAMEARLKNEVIDVTLPAKKNSVGHRHPNTIALEEVERIFVGMGYEVVRGPEVEKDYYNFEALNIPKDHPARDEQDTFYINEDLSGSGSYHGTGQAADPYDRARQSIPFRRSGCNPFSVLPSDRRSGYR